MRYAREAIRKGLFMTADCGGPVLTRKDCIRPGAFLTSDCGGRVELVARPQDIVTKSAPVHGQAWAMAVALARLARQHGGVPTPTPRPLALAAPAEGDLFVTGFASTPDVDFERVKCAPHSLSWSSSLVPLLIRHDADQIAGVVDALNYDSAGRLSVRATLTHPLAKQMPAFSIAATVHSFTMRNENTPDFYAEVTKAVLDEVSVTDRPANPQALMLWRHEMPAAFRKWRASQLEFTANVGRFFACARQAVDLLQQQYRQPPPPVARGPRPASDWAKLASHLNQQGHKLV